MIQPLDIKPIKLEYHSLADLFPLPSPDQRKTLKESIMDNGQHEPIALFDGQILDGRTRYQLCLELGIEPKFTEDLKGLAPIEFVTVKNLARRHLKSGQQVCVAAEILVLKTQDYKNRLKGKRPFGSVSNNGARSIDQVSKSMNVSVSGLARAATLMKHDRGAFNEVKAGKISLFRAYHNYCPSQAEKKIKNAANHVDKVARDIIENIDLQEFDGTIPKVYASDFEVWTFDKFMKRKGYNLSLVRVGDNFDAKYTKDDSYKIEGYCNSFKTAIIAAAREILENEKVTQP